MSIFTHGIKQTISCLELEFGPELEPIFHVGDLVIPTIRIPYARPAFCDSECRVTAIKDGKVYATLTKWNKVPSWGFKSRELVLFQSAE